jgi:hypothetical protein
MGLYQNNFAEAFSKLIVKSGVTNCLTRKSFTPLKASD